MAKRPEYKLIVKWIAEDFVTYGKTRQLVEYIERAFAERPKHTELLWKRVERAIRKKRAMVLENVGQAGGDPDKCLAYLKKIRKEHLTPDAPWPEETALPVVAHGNPDPPSVEDYITAMETNQDLQAYNDPYRANLDIHIATDKPHILAVFGDMHLGAFGVDYQRWYEAYKKWRSLEGMLSLVVNGDWYENCRLGPTVAAVDSQVATTVNQRGLVSAMIRELRGQLLGITAGNHERRDLKQIGIHLLKQIAIRHNVPFFDAQLRLTVRIGKTIPTSVPYRFVIAHKGPSRSKKNPSLAAIRLWELYPEFDGAFVAHTHVPEIREHYLRDGRKVVFGVSGTDNTSAEYAYFEYGSSGARCIPCVVLHPGTKEFYLFASIEAAERYVRGWVAAQ